VATLEELFLEESRKDIWKDATPEAEYDLNSVLPEREKRVLGAIVDNAQVLQCTVSNEVKLINEKAYKANKFQQGCGVVYRLLDRLGITSPSTRLHRYVCHLEEVSEDCGRLTSVYISRLENLAERRKELLGFGRDAKKIYFKYSVLEENLRASGAPAADIEQCAYKKRRAACQFIVNSQALKYAGKEQEMLRFAVDGLEKVKNELELRIGDFRTVTNHPGVKIPSDFEMRIRAYTLLKTEREEFDRQIKAKLDELGKACTVAVTATAQPYVSQEHTKSHSS
jgi:hypothetical protein